ncbi:hypothetical protein [Mycobacterium uberis]|uniref:hypothetical protein n=1 Tax=Mycobacterium uberis TaxID=2162698 RepID=UPI001FB4D63B|nr:hypothetical protein [Mycobacterium uberis]
MSHRRGWPTSTSCGFCYKEVLTAAGGSRDNWQEYDRMMVKERRAVALIVAMPVYSNG